jgi:hypothetical protein
MAALRPAPDWRIAHWLNASAPLSVEALRGKAILAVAFQMLCPGCVSLSLPQAQRARATFDPRDLAVVGVHTVFEHHEAQGSPQALAAFLHEYRIDFPVGIDAQSKEGVPETMRAYQMQGTPTTILIDRAGMLRLQKFGHLDDLRLGAAIQDLIGETTFATVAKEVEAAGACDEDGCSITAEARV